MARKNLEGVGVRQVGVGWAWARGFRCEAQGYSGHHGGWVGAVQWPKASIMMSHDGQGKEAGDQ